MARGRRKRSSRRMAALIIGLAVVAGAYWKWGRSGSETPPPRSGDKLAATSGAIPLRSDTPGPRPERKPPVIDPRATAGSERAPAPATPANRRPMPTGEARALLQTGRVALSRGDWLLAREKLDAAFQAGLSPHERNAVRAELARIADETLFSPRVTGDDPLVGMYTIRPGDTLAKIAQAHSVTADFLARINGIKDKNRIRGGQRIKVVNGPFHAVVNKSAFDLDVYLLDTFVKHFPVGLGADDSTPLGEWKVANKLTNPTYYPPRGGKIIPADDPENPLGERWIGLEGLSGEAAGQERYGIHGTVDPGTVGQAVSMGCIRLRNPDVEDLFDMLVTGRSRVIIRE